jgi:hypothetical protein
MSKQTNFLGISKNESKATQEIETVVIKKQKYEDDEGCDTPAGRIRMENTSIKLAARSSPP